MARRHNHSDPLDLLLDTMTNAFGAIIMIAISVSLFVNETKKADSPAAASKAEMTQRKSTRAADEIEAARKFGADLEGKLQQAGDIAQMIKDRDALKEKVGVAETELKMESHAENPKPGAVMGKLAALSGEVMTLKERTAKLTEQTRAMGQVAASKQAKQTMDLTPPAPVRDTKKSPFPLIFRHNRLYPLMVYDPGGVMKNETAVKWTPLGSAAGAEPIMEVEPIAGAGIDAERNEAAVREFIGTLRKTKSSIAAGGELYVASYVYKDSFSAYLKFKQLFNLANTGIGHGWEPVLNDDNLRFGETGFKPGEQ